MVRDREVKEVGRVERERWDVRVGRERWGVEVERGGERERWNVEVSRKKQDVGVVERELRYWGGKRVGCAVGGRREIWNVRMRREKVGMLEWRERV